MTAGIFCIENWTGDLRSRATVLPLLEFLAASDGTRFIHQRVSTPRELRHYLGRFAGLTDYRVGYLALHGERGVVNVGRHRVTLEHLAAWTSLEPGRVTDEDLDDPEWLVDLKGKVLYLGSCSSLRVSHDRLERLRRDTNARLVCGYTKDVDWFASGGFDVTLLSTLAGSMDTQRRNPTAAIERLRRRAGDLLEHLGFISVPDSRQKGRSRGRSRETQIQRFRENARLRNSGADWAEIASQLGVPRPTLAKIRKAAVDAGYARKEANGLVTWPVETARWLGPVRED